jgi:hypothetical protein
MLTQTSKVVIEDLITDFFIIPEADCFMRENDRNMTKPWFLQKVPSPISIEDIFIRFNKGGYSSYTQVLADVDLMIQQRLLGMSLPLLSSSVVSRGFGLSFCIMIDASIR